MSNESTPSPRKKITLSGVLSTLIPLVVGAAVGVFGAMYIISLTDGSDALYFLYFGLLLLGLVAAFLVQIIVHEGGHLVFGLMSGYRFVSFNILGFIWQKDADGRIHRGRMQIAGAGGQCLMAPPEYNGGDFPFTLYNLGGVMMNLISAVLCALLAWAVPFAPVEILLVAQVLVAVVSAATNGLPIPVASIQNDCKNLLCIRRDLQARRAFWVQMAIAAETARGTRLKSMPKEWFAPFPEEAMDNPIICSVAVLNTSRLMDKLDFLSAESAIRRLMAREKGVLGLYRMTMGCDGAVCELIADRPGDLTASLEAPEIQQMMKAMKDHPAIIRTQYALALLKEHDPEKARRLLTAFEAAARKHPHPQEVTGERELLLAIQHALLTDAADGGVET